MSWLPLQSVGTVCFIHILRSNVILKSYGLTHVDHYAFDIDSIFCESQTTKARNSNARLTFASAKLVCSNISNLDSGLILIAFASAKLECSNISDLVPGIQSHWLGDSHCVKFCLECFNHLLTRAFLLIIFLFKSVIFRKKHFKDDFHSRMLIFL